MRKDMSLFLSSLYFYWPGMLMKCFKMQMKTFGEMLSDSVTMEKTNSKMIRFWSQLICHNI